MEASPQVQAILDKYAKLPKGARIGVMIGTAAMFALLYYFMVYQTMSMELETLHAKESQLQAKLSEVRSIAANIAAFETEIEDLEAKLHIALKQLPNEKQLEVLLTDISNLGKTAGVEVKSFRRQAEVRHDFYAEVPIAIALEGEYHAIARFFDLLSKLPRIVNMGAITMSIESESVDSTRLAISGTATTFRFVGNG
jgi:type IV pilus assembly protein PilO